MPTNRILNLGRKYKYLCAFKTNDLMIYCSRSSTNYNESCLSLSLTCPRKWIYACHMEQREKTTTFDVCYLLSIYTYIQRIILFLFSYLSLSTQHLYPYNIIKENFDVNVLRICDTTHHSELENETTSKRWNEFFCVFYLVTFSSAMYIQCV